MSNIDGNNHYPNDTNPSTPGSVKVGQEFPIGTQVDDTDIPVGATVEWDYKRTCGTNPMTVYYSSISEAKYLRGTDGVDGWSGLGGAFRVLTIPTPAASVAKPTGNMYVRTVLAMTNLELLTRSDGTMADKAVNDYLLAVIEQVSVPTPADAASVAKADDRPMRSRAAAAANPNDPRFKPHPENKPADAASGGESETEALLKRIENQMTRDASMSSSRMDLWRATHAHIRRQSERIRTLEQQLAWQAKSWREVFDAQPSREPPLASHPLAPTPVVSHGAAVGETQGEVPTWVKELPAQLMDEHRQSNDRCRIMCRQAAQAMSLMLSDHARALAEVRGVSDLRLSDINELNGRVATAESALASATERAEKAERDVVYLRQMQTAWSAVCDTLQETCPGWATGPDATGIDKMRTAIKGLTQARAESARLRGALEKADRWNARYAAALNEIATFSVKGPPDPSAELKIVKTFAVSVGSHKTLHPPTVPANTTKPEARQ